MKVLRTEVKQDHLERLLRGSPIGPLSELIWNALDADARRVDVEFSRDLVRGITELVVRDDGTGISELDAESGFRHLGGSWKRNGGLTKGERRVLHGRAGQGRFAAFALGSIVEWHSVAEGKDGKISVSISGTRDRLGEFQLEVSEAPAEHATGTTVRIAEVAEHANSLLQPEAEAAIAESFAVYLKQYPHVRVFVAGDRVDPSALEAHRAEYSLPVIAADEVQVADARLIVIEWKRVTTRSLHFCDADGISRHSVALPTVRAPGFEFTAYVSSGTVARLADTNDLLLGETHPVVAALQSAAVEALRSHFRRRAAERAAGLVSDWKKSGVYPYEGEPKSAVERTERQVFEVVAASVSTYLPDFDRADVKSQKFSFSLLRESIANNPDSMQRVLGEVLGLPKTRLDELAELLEKTSLSAIISASKLITDRLSFLHAIESLLFDTESKENFLERSQLHRILADHTWIFGEEFNLSVDDESLTSVLAKHIEALGRSELNPPTPVRGKGGRRQIVDLMLSRRVLRNNAAEVEHIVVELKRPKQKIDQKVFTQIHNYAQTVAKDERFRGLNTKWSFWALSNELDEFVEQQARMTGRPRGVIGYWEDQGITIWAKTWSEILNDAKARLEFVRRALEFSVDRDSALSALRRTHENYFPASMRSDNSAA